MAERRNLTDCPVRELLAAQFERHLDHYTETFLGLFEKMGEDMASTETQGLYEACLEARKALHDHERDHGCFE